VEEEGWRFVAFDRMLTQPFRNDDTRYALGYRETVQ
jgi:hypothetical protein